MKPKSSARKKSHPKNQKSDVFFGLPVEVRFLIYEELLVCKEPLMARYNRPSGAEFSTGVVKNYGLDPAILRTCKAAATEGKTLLYQSNTPCLHLRYPCSRWGPAEYREKIEPPAWEKPLAWVSAFEKAPLVVRRYPKHTSKPSLEIVDSTNQFILRFRKLRVQVESMVQGINYWDMEEILPLLQPIFTDRCVDVIILPSREGTDNSLRRHLPFLGIRCKEFAITGAPEDEVERLCRVITSSEPVPDISKIGKQLDGALSFIGCYGVEDYLKEEAETVRNELHMAKIEYDLAKYDNVRKHVQVLVKEVERSAICQIRRLSERVVAETFQAFS